MEITPKTSKKRKQSSSSITHMNDYPISGVLTRQKTRKYFFNHNRSGKSRKCTSVPQLPPKNSPEIKGDFIESVGDDDGGDGGGGGSCASIKDLRARRVFSKPPKKGKLEKIEKGKFDSMLVDEIGDNQADLIDVNPNLFDVNDVVNSIVQELNCRNPNLSDDSDESDLLIDSENPNSFADSVKSDLGFNDLNPNLLVSDKNGDSRVNSVADTSNDGGLNQLISPEKCLLVRGDGEKFSDATIPNLNNVSVEGRFVEKCETENVEIVQSTPPETVFINQKSGEDNVLKSRSYVPRLITKQISKEECGDLKNFSNPQKEMTLSKCSRRKVFRVPNSFTYKRLLPYLTDMAKDEPSKPDVEAKMYGEEKRIVSLSGECTFDSPKLSEKILGTLTDCASQKVVICPGSQIDSVPNESQMPDNSKRDVTQHKHMSPDNLAVTLDGLKTSPELSNNGIVLDPLCQLSVNSEGECKAADLGFKADESTINKSNSSNPNLMMPKKLINSRHPNFSVLKKCDSGFSDQNPNLPVPEKNDDCRAGLVAHVVNDGDLNELMLSRKRVSKDGNGENFSDAMSPNSTKDLLEVVVVENCAVEDEEIVQTTPPEAVLVIRKSDEDNVLNARSFASRSAKKELSPSKGGCGDVKNFSNSRKEMALSKSSRRKVFKVPNSFTYKRLLPYLMNMAKDEPCELPAYLNVQAEMDVDGPKLSEKVLATMVVCASQEVGSNPRIQMGLVPNESQMADDSKQDVTQHERILPDTLAVTLDTVKTSPEMSKNDVVLDPPCHLSVNSEVECNTANVEFKAEESTINQSYSSNPNLVIEHPNFPMLKKCDLGFSNPNPNLPVLEKSSVLEGDLYQSMLPVKHVTEVGNSEKFSDAMSPNSSKDLVEGRVVENCTVEDEETVQTTPPEEVLESRNSDDDNVSDGRRYALRSATKEMNPSKDGFGDVKNFSNSRKEMTLSKCSRRKVFKVPNSFTYKRLLPYLMDTAKDGPCELMANPTVQTEMDIDENPVIILSEKSLATVAVCVPQNVSIDLKDDLSDDLNTDTPSSQTDSFPEVSKQDISSEPPCHLSVDSEGEHIAADREFKAEESTINRSNSSNKLAIVVSSDAPVAGLTKGILKRNPRGCRGICSCLNCASFRLNAEKALEFSRNQMLEADELTQGLLKEISSLNCMLKKSVQGNTEAENVRVTQVEEACRRASTVEDMARTRLRQMHEDLFVHCRTKALHRPRVNFSENGAAGEPTMQDEPLISP